MEPFMELSHFDRLLGAPCAPDPSGGADDEATPV
jgi:hypothetical protein